MLSRRLDTATSLQLEAEFKSSLNGITELNLDFKDLEYLSSASLRVLLVTQKVLNKKCKITFLYFFMFLLLPGGTIDTIKLGTIYLLEQCLSTHS